MGSLHWPFDSYNGPRPRSCAGPAKWWNLPLHAFLEVIPFRRPKPRSWLCHGRGVIGRLAAGQSFCSLRLETCRYSYTTQFSPAVSPILPELPGLDVLRTNMKQTQQPYHTNWLFYPFRLHLPDTLPIAYRHSLKVL